MKKKGNPNSISKILILSLAAMLSFSLTSKAQGADAAKGKEIFNTNCAACHNLDKKMTGPALRGVSAKYDKEWLYKWVKNSSELIKSGDAQAVKIFEENNKSVMTSFPQLSNADIDNIIAYTDEVKAEAPVATTAGTPGTVAAEDGISNNVILGALIAVMLMLITMLYIVNNLLTKIAKANGIEIQKLANENKIPIWKAFVKNQFLVLVSVIILIT